MPDSHHLLLSVAETIADSIAGYTHIGEHAAGFRLYAVCEHRAAERQKHLNELLQVMRAHGWSHRVHGTLLGSAHRLFVNLKAAVTHDENAMVNELYRGEQYLLTKVENALDTGRFDVPIEATLERIADDIEAAADELAQHRGPVITIPPGGRRPTDRSGT